MERNEWKSPFPQKMKKVFVIVVTVVAIFGVITGGVLWLLYFVQEDTKRVRALGDISAIEASLEIYESRVAALPTTEQGLMALVEEPTIEPIPRNWSQTLMRIPWDPWGNEYGYKNLKPETSNNYEIISAGADGEFGTEDDISSSKLRDDD